jgi:hypothetical protein
MFARRIQAAAAGQSATPRRRHRRAGLIAATVAGAAGLGLIVTAVVPAVAQASTKTNCQAVPSACGFPDATNTGVPAGMTLKAVPGQVTSGPGWAWNAYWQRVNVTVNGTVLSGLSVSGSINITASNVTINDDQVVTGAAEGIALSHTAGVTIENSTISGLNATSGRVDSAIDDIYGDSTGMVVKADNISECRSAVQLTGGLVTGNYIHDPGYITGDHTNGVIANGGTQQLTITHNTILNSQSQTDAISLDTNSVAGPVTNKVIENNLLAGGGYPIYGGAAFGHVTSGVLIENNVFGQGFYATSGQFGPSAYVDPTGAGNVWSGNTWDRNGATVPAP